MHLPEDYFSPIIEFLQQTTRYAPAVFKLTNHYISKFPHLQICTFANHHINHSFLFSGKLLIFAQQVKTFILEKTTRITRKAIRQNIFTNVFSGDFHSAYAVRLAVY